MHGIGAGVWSRFTVVATTVTVWADGISDMTQDRTKSFLARGGIWVIAQAPVLLLALVIPIWDGAGRLAPAGMTPLAGVALSVLGILWTAWGLASLGDALTPFPRPRDEATLHRQGAYRFVRHPIYAGLMLAAVGWALWWLSPAGLLYALALAVFFDRKAAREELWLRQRYREYADYERRVKKFIPGLY